MQKFEMSAKTAQKFVSVAERFGAKSELGSHLTLSAFTNSPSLPRPPRCKLKSSAASGDRLKPAALYSYLILLTYRFDETPSGPKAGPTLCHMGQIEPMKKARRGGLQRRARLGMDPRKVQTGAAKSKQVMCRSGTATARRGALAWSARRVKRSPLLAFLTL
jgi:hypothetical protein